MGRQWSATQAVLSLLLAPLLIALWRVLPWWRAAARHCAGMVGRRLLVCRAGAIAAPRVARNRHAKSISCLATRSTRQDTLASVRAGRFDPQPKYQSLRSGDARCRIAGCTDKERGTARYPSHCGNRARRVRLVMSDKTKPTAMTSNDRALSLRPPATVRACHFAGTVNARSPFDRPGRDIAYPDTAQARNSSPICDARLRNSGT
jgi:hypothetical protein